MEFILAVLQGICYAGIMFGVAAFVWNILTLFENYIERSNEQVRKMKLDNDMLEQTLLATKESNRQLKNSTV